MFEVIARAQMLIFVVEPYALACVSALPHAGGVMSPFPGR